MSKPRLILLRRFDEDGDIIEASDVAIARMATDAEIEAVWRVPGRWSYVVRDPTGAIAATGADDTQEACLHYA